jgi:serine/threonine protein kinase/tetratricopeptide (TPR) repeat protein
MTTQCPKCKAENPDTKSFCGDCGTQLGPSKDIPTQTKTLVTPAQELSRGTTIAGRYEIIERLGTGGMGTVYRVEDKKIHEDVALKLIKPEIAADKKTIERFSNELKVARKIAHRNVCKMYDIGESEGAHFITMEYVPGEDLKSFMRRAKQLSIPTVISIAKQICGGLDEAHKLGIVHRDLKPSNIMIDKDANVHIMDFGIARSVKAEGITGTGVMIGTPEYMSPEQVESKVVDQRSDLYSLGVILYEMVAGRVPFEGETPLSIARKHADEKPPDPKSINPQISDDLSHLILRCLEKEKESRYQSAEELITELGNIEKGIPSTAREIPKRKPITSKEITVTLGWKKLFIPALVILVLAVGVFLLFRESGPELDPNRIVVAIFDNQTGDPAHDAIGHMAADWISQGLAQTGLIDIVPSFSVEQIYSGYEGEDPLRFLTRNTKAGTLITGTYYLKGNMIQFHVQVIDAQDGKLLKALDPVSGLVEDPTKPIQSLREQLITTLALFFEPELKDWAELMYMPSSNEAYMEYLEGRVLLFQVKFRQAIEHFSRAVALDPGFAQPRLMSVWAYINLGEYAKADALIQEVDELSDKLVPYDSYTLEKNKAWVRGDYYGMYRAQAQIVQLAPSILYEKNDLGEIAVWINRPQEAVDLLLQVDPEGPGLKGWFPYWNFLTMAHHMLGDHKQELKAAQRGRRQYPDQLWTLIFEIRALAALGKIKEVNERLDECLNFPLERFPDPHVVMYWARGTLRAHGYKEASFQVNDRAIKWLKNRPKEEAETERHHGRLATALSFAEKWEEAQVQCEEFQKEYPDNIISLGFLGALAARRGDRDEALRIAGLLENEKRPYLFGLHTFWRARIAALLGEKERAVRLLREAHAQGVKFFNFHHDMDLEPLHDYPPFEEFMKPKG